MFYWQSLDKEIKSLRARVEELEEQIRIMSLGQAQADWKPIHSMDQFCCLSYEELLMNLLPLLCYFLI